MKNDEDSLHVGILSVVLTTIDYDSMFTVIHVMAGRQCTQAGVTFIWFLWIAITFIYGGLLIFRSIIGYCSTKEGKHHKKNYNWFDRGLGLAMVISITSVFGFYLLGDNRQPFDCTSLPFTSKSGLKLFFLLCAFCIYTPTCVYFGIAIFFRYKDYKTTELPLQIDIT